MWIITSAKNGVSSCEIARSLGVIQKSAWFMLHRIRLAMQNGSLLKIGGNGGEVEADETFISGKARNMREPMLTFLLVLNAVAVDAHPYTAPGQPTQLFGQFPVGEAVHGDVDRNLRPLQHFHFASFKVRRRRVQQHRPGVSSVW